MPGPEGPGLLRSFIERHRDDARAGAAAADVDVELAAGRACARPAGRPCRSLSSDTASACRWSRRRRFVVADVGVVAVARDAAVEHLEADDLARARRPPSARAAPPAPMKSSFFQPTIQPRSASSAVVVSSMSLPYRRIAGLEAQRVARAEAARDDARPPGPIRGSPARPGRPTAAARRSRSRPRRCSRCATRWRGRWPPPRARTSSTSCRPRSTPVSGCRTFERRGALQREQRVARARSRPPRRRRRP